MKKIVCLLSTATLLAFSPVTLAGENTTPMAEAVAVLDQVVADGKLNFAVAAVGNVGGQTWSHAAGYQDAEKTRPASPDNIIQIASMTKLVTTIAALQLMEQGKLDLDTPISAYAPELNELQVLKGFAPDDTPIFEKANRAPTARELMTHTAGYVYEIWNANALKGGQLGVNKTRDTSTASPRGVAGLLELIFVTSGSVVASALCNSMRMNSKALVGFGFT